METLREQDRTLLNLLQRDCRLSNQELAEQAGMSPSACWRRIRQFEADGIIDRYTAILKAEAAGLNFSAILHITLTRHNAEAVATFISSVTARPEVLECLATTGEADYHLRVVCIDKDAYNLFLEEFLFRLPGVAHVRTNLVLKEIKLETRLPV